MSSFDTPPTDLPDPSGRGVVAADGATVAPAAADLPRVSKKFIIAYSLASLATATAVNTPIFITLALRIAEIAPDDKTIDYSMLSSAGMLVATLCIPVVGTLSDMTLSRFGMRRPWFLFGLLGTSIGSVLVGMAGSIPTLAVGYLVMCAAGTAITIPLLAVIADRVPEHQQGVLSGVVGGGNLISSMLGSIVVALIPSSSFWQVNLPMVVCVVAVLAFALFRDKTFAEQRPNGPHIGMRWSDVLDNMYFRPREAPDFARVLGAMFLVTIGVALSSTYTVYSLQDHVKVDSSDLNNSVAFVTIFATLPALVLSPLAGSLAEKYGRWRPYFAAGALIAALGVLISFGGRTLPWYYTGALINGVGTALYSGVYVGYAITTMGDTEHKARNLGLTNIALSLPLAIAPLLGPIFLNIGPGAGDNYVSLSLAACVFMAASVPVLFRIRSVR
ncbi:putative MFS transporter [Actinoplanes missouriensis 431]|uniref:Putative MFS transporter n=1 Tax=Actinoplanes missouriensis (strain ATCC 14538 / DSM 43046 / CBS 188.64 / JCM 3121 / NBRC 102363 / NCIMB 12654 / NRRL B-3342 / UNCC 431) TaxID=512565 RepID=I0H4K1_ACTM4|nr:MFS transporter [Actinoplanes missouriensis]BAL87938.1 putative MFS transporter [Actinoplanes missouriensis 431]